MPIRDIVVTAAILSTLPFCLFRPWIGLLVWAWLAFMNPHRLTWGFAYDLPFGQVVALATLAGFVFTGDRKPFLWTREILLVIALWVWFTVTSCFAMYPEAAWDKWNQVTKILLMALLAVPLLQDRRRLRLLLLVISISIGLYGLKGGLFALATGGRWMVLGPPNSFFEANTELGLVLNMSLPISLYLAREEPRRWLRRVLWATFVCSAVAVPFTYSRGAVLGLAVVLALLFVKAKRRLLLVPVALALLVAFAWFAPRQFVNRIETLEDYEADESAQLRFMSWRMGYLIASDHPLVGGGFQVFVHRATYDIYVPEYPRSFGHDAHSIYFNLLGEHGWVGLGLFAALIACCFGSLRRLRRLRHTHPELEWMSNWAHMLEVCLTTYLVTGAFLSAAYFDLAYQLIILVGLLSGLSRQLIAAAAPAPAVVPMRRAKPLTTGSA